AEGWLHAKAQARDRGRELTSVHTSTTVTPPWRPRPACAGIDGRHQSESLADIGGRRTERASTGNRADHPPRPERQSTHLQQSLPEHAGIRTRSGARCRSAGRVSQRAAAAVAHNVSAAYPYPGSFSVTARLGGMTMRRYTTALALLLALWFVLPNDAAAVPAFSRQTGMNCNSCHIGTYPTPRFTQTGMLFAARGYTRPYVRE